VGEIKDYKNYTKFYNIFGRKKAMTRLWGESGEKGTNEHVVQTPPRKRPTPK
jgi:predicted DNA-binding WGR domain protein